MAWIKDAPGRNRTYDHRLRRHLRRSWIATGSRLASLWQAKGAYQELTERDGPRLPIVPSQFFSAEWIATDSQDRAEVER